MVEKMDIKTYHLKASKIINFLIIGFLLFMSIAGPLVGQSEVGEVTQRVIVLMGPPGSGKGTQATRLAETFHIPHISTGDLFRENMSKNTELGKKARSYIDAGKLVPDSVVLEMLYERLSKPDCAKGYLLDGCPRTIPQAEDLERYLANQKVVLVALDLEVSDEMVIKRLAGRLNCKNCGALYNRYFSPPKQEGICDRCGGTLSQRDDDKPEVIRERLKAYKEQTKPLLDYYRKKGVLEQVNGERGVDTIFQELALRYRNHSKDLL